MFKRISNFVSTAVAINVNPYKVDDVKFSTYLRCEKLKVEDIFQLLRVANHIEMLFHMPSWGDQAFSLFRIQDAATAELLFAQYSCVLRTLAQISTGLANRSKLEASCELLRHHRGWTAAHLAVYLRMLECLRAPALQPFIDCRDPQTGERPLHLAVQAADLSIIRELLLNCAVDLLAVDNDGNNVLHMIVKAASSSSSGTNNSVDALQLLLGRVGAHLVNHVNVSGETALHLAASKDNENMLRILLLAGADPLLMSSQEAPIHAAMRANSLACVKALCEVNSNCVNLVDKTRGRCALHCVRSREAVYLLALQSGAILDLPDAGGKTPLHALVTDMVLEVTNEKDRERWLETLVALLICGASASIPDDLGDSPLHTAVRTFNVDVVRALLVFEADVNHINRAGYSPRHVVATEPEKDTILHKLQIKSTKKEKDVILYTLHHVGATRCSSSVFGCSIGCSANGKHNGSIPDACIISEEDAESSIRMVVNSMKRSDSIAVNSGASGTRVACNMSTNNMTSSNISSNDSTDYGSFAEKKDVFCSRGERLLALDGGGIRGLILCQILRGLERRLDGKSVGQLFDWIAGTSTGGIVAMALAKGRSAAYGRSLYMRVKDEIFSGNRPYDTEPLEKVMKEEFGENTVMTDIESPPRVMAMALLADRFPPRLHIFRNYSPPMRTLQQAEQEAAAGFLPPPVPQEQLVWRAARASGAAPTFFRAAGRFLDGGLIANNPTLDALTEIQQHFSFQGVQRPSIELVVSVGTGCIPVTPCKQIDIFRPGGPIDIVRSAMGVSSLGRILIEQACQSDGQVVQRAQSLCALLDVPYYRFSPPISADVPLDCLKTSVLLQMLWETEAYLYRCSDRLDKLANHLLA